MQIKVAKEMDCPYLHKKCSVNKCMAWVTTKTQRGYTIEENRLLKDFEREKSDILKSYGGVFSCVQGEEVVKKIESEITDLEEKYKEVLNLDRVLLEDEVEGYCCRLDKDFKKDNYENR